MANSDADRLKYDLWVRAYAPQLYRYAYRLSGDRQVAEDLLQETFLEAWRGIEKQTDDARARAWLFQILRHRHAHYLRDTRRQRQTRSLAENSDEHAADAAPLEALAERDAMQAALQTLSPVIRETFLMVFVEGRTCREVAEMLEIPIGTVLSRTDSGRRALRAVLQPNGSPMPRTPSGESAKVRNP